jgi:hypothetical protein
LNHWKWASEVQKLKSDIKIAKSLSSTEYVPPGEKALIPLVDFPNKN